MLLKSLNLLLSIECLVIKHLHEGKFGHSFHLESNFMIGISNAGVCFIKKKKNDQAYMVKHCSPKQCDRVGLVLTAACVKTFPLWVCGGGGGGGVLLSDSSKGD